MSEEVNLNLETQKQEKRRGRPRIYNFQTVEEYNEHKNQLSKKSYHKIKAEKEKEKEKENQTNKNENNDTSKKNENNA